MKLTSFFKKKSNDLDYPSIYTIYAPSEQELLKSMDSCWPFFKINDNNANNVCPNVVRTNWR
jgi:hypothetical protein